MGRECPDEGMIGKKQDAAPEGADIFRPLRDVISTFRCSVGRMGDSSYFNSEASFIAFK